MILSSAEMRVWSLTISVLYTRGVLTEILVAIILYFQMVIDSNKLSEIQLDLTLNGFHSNAHS